MKLTVYSELWFSHLLPTRTAFCKSKNQTKKILMFVVFKLIPLLILCDSELEAIGGIDGGVGDANLGGSHTSETLLCSSGTSGSTIDTRNQPFGGVNEPAGFSVDINSSSTIVGGNEQSAVESQPNALGHNRELVGYILEQILDVVVATAVPPRFVRHFSL
jgi:hypothetical protein